MEFTELYCEVDDFCKTFEPVWKVGLITDGLRKRLRESGLSLSELMTIVIGFHHSGYRTFKHYYRFLDEHHRTDFPGLMSYSRLIRLLPGTLVPLSCYLKSRFGTCTGISFIDSTKLCVCEMTRKNRHRTFEGIAALGKSSTGWFFGFKLHLVINEQGDLLGVHVTPGNVDDRKIAADLLQHVRGKVFGDKGYISQALFDELWEHGVQLITSIRKNMKNRLMPLEDKIGLRKRSLIETVNDHLKNVCQIEHSRHRSPMNFAVHLLGALCAYTHLPTRPHLNVTPQDRLLLTAA